MIMDQKTSIIIPCYNAELFLFDTVNSVLRQDYQNYEIILIDDGSTDNTRSILDSFKNQYPEKILTEYGPNKGVSAARNRGTELSCGEILQYLDADDILRPSTLKIRAEALEQSNADIGYTDFQHLLEQPDGTYKPGKVISRKIEDIHPSPEISLFTDFWVPPAAIIYKREIVEKIDGWREDLPVIQDARFALDAALHGGKFVYIPSIGADYRVSLGSSLSKRDPLRFHIDCFTNAQQINQFWIEHGGLSTERRRALEYVYGFTAEYLFWHDANLFNKNLELLDEVQPSFTFSFAKVAAKMTQAVGINNARKIMPILQKLKKKVKPSSTFARGSH